MVMAKRKERKKTYKFIEKLIDKVTTSKSNNTEFVCYGHLVELLSGTEDYVSVTIYNTDDRYGEGMADFDFDYLTKELHFISSEGKALTEKIIAIFRMFYSPPGTFVSLMMNSNTRTRTPPTNMTRRTNTPRLSSI